MFRFADQLGELAGHDIVLRRRAEQASRPDRAAPAASAQRRDSWVATLFRRRKTALWARPETD